MELNEQQELRETQYFPGLLVSPGWAKVKAFIQALCEEANVELLTNNDSRTDTEKRIRAQQRLLMRDDIFGYVEAQALRHREIRENLEGAPSYEHDPSSAND